MAEAAEAPVIPTAVRRRGGGAGCLPSPTSTIICIVQREKKRKKKQHVTFFNSEVTVINYQLSRNVAHTLLAYSS